MRGNNKKGAKSICSTVRLKEAKEEKIYMISWETILYVDRTNM